MTTDMVNQPPHYTSHPSGVECIDVAKHMGFVLGNAFKYVWRFGMKGNATQDIDKAMFYLRLYINSPELPPLQQFVERVHRRRLAAACPFEAVRSVDRENWPLIYIYDGWRLDNRDLLLLAISSLEYERSDLSRRERMKNDQNTRPPSPYISRHTHGVHQRAKQ